jgi:hypothetical protein
MFPLPHSPALIVDPVSDIVFGYLYSIMTEQYQKCKLLSKTDQYQQQKSWATSLIGNIMY